jgi:DNA repair protein RadC
MFKNEMKPNQISLSYKRAHKSELPLINSPSIAINTLRDMLEDDILDLKEHYWVLLLTSDKHLLGISQTNSGTVVGVDIYVREVLQLALVTNAVSIILVHNHPSGNLEPSDADIEITRKLKEIGKFMNITLKDHLIITSEDYNSINNYL